MGMTLIDDLVLNKARKIKALWLKKYPKRKITLSDVFGIGLDKIDVDKNGRF